MDRSRAARSGSRLTHRYSSHRDTTYKPSGGLTSGGYCNFSHLAAGGDVCEGDENKTDEACDGFGDAHEDGREHRKRKSENGPVRAVFKVDKALKCSRPYEVHCESTHENRPDAKTRDDD